MRPLAWNPCIGRAAKRNFLQLSRGCGASEYVCDTKRMKSVSKHGLHCDEGGIELHIYEGLI